MDSDEQNKQFHTNEAISAVADDVFLEDDDDEYEDLYNDVNVGEGFLQSLQSNDLEAKDDQQDEKKVGPVADQGGSAKVEITVAIPGVGEERKGGILDLGFPEKVLVDEGFRNNFDDVSKVPAKFGGLPDLGMGRIEEQVGVLGFSGSESVKRPSIGVGSQLAQPSSKLVETNVAPGNQVELIRNENLLRQGGVGNGNVGSSSSGGGGGTILFVGDLHWWTTDAELESELRRYGLVKEVKFFEEKASGKSKGYCQVEFYDPTSAMACKEGMNGHVFNGRPCVVAHASPYSIRRMGEAQVNKNQAMRMGEAQVNKNHVMAQAMSQPQGRRGVGDVGGRGNAIGVGVNYHGGDGGRNFGKMGWGRGGGYGQGMGYRGQIRNKVGMGGRGIMGNGAGSGGAGGAIFGQGLGPPPLWNPQAMIGQGFDPTYGAHMGRLGSYGGFSAPTPPFPGILSSFPPVGTVGLPGVAPHVNPAFFGRGMPASGMGIMPPAAVEGPAAGMWPDPNTGGWAGDEHGGRTGESSYGEDAASDHQYGEMSHERGGRVSVMKEKDRVSDRDWSGNYEQRHRDDRETVWERDGPREKDMGSDRDWLDRRHRDDRDSGWDKDRYRDEKDRYADHSRHRDREMENDDDWDRGRPSGTRSRSRLSREEDQPLRSRDVEYGKRRRPSSE